MVNRQSVVFLRWTDSSVYVCVMAILFCSLWLGQIVDFKYLNNAKFKVLQYMAPLIEFDISHGRPAEGLLVVGPMNV